MPSTVTPSERARRTCFLRSSDLPFPWPILHRLAYSLSHFHFFLISIRRFMVYIWARALVRWFPGRARAVPGISVTLGTYSFAGTFTTAIWCIVALEYTAHHLAPLPPVLPRSPQPLLAAHYGILEKKNTCDQTVFDSARGWCVVVFSLQLKEKNTNTNKQTNKTVPP